MDRFARFRCSSTSASWRGRYRGDSGAPPTGRAGGAGVPASGGAGRQGRTTARQYQLCVRRVGTAFGPSPAFRIPKRECVPVAMPLEIRKGGDAPPMTVRRAYGPMVAHLAGSVRAGPLPSGFSWPVEGGGGIRHLAHGRPGREEGVVSARPLAAWAYQPIGRDKPCGAAGGSGRRWRGSAGDRIAPAQAAAPPTTIGRPRWTGPQVLWQKAAIGPPPASRFPTESWHRRLSSSGGFGGGTPGSGELGGRGGNFPPPLR